MKDRFGEEGEGPIETAAAGPGEGRLDSWKAIAQYLRRDVATVRRWEKSGLPVRRVAGLRGKSVYAYATDIDEWLKASGAAEASSAVPGSTDHDAPEPVARSSGRLRSAAGLLVVVLAAIGIGLPSWRGAGPAPAPGIVRVSLTPAAIEAFDARDRLAWRYPLAQDGRVVPTDTDDAARIIVGASPGVFVGTSMAFGRDSNAVSGGVLYALRMDGRLRWSYRAEDQIRFGGQVYGPPWPLTSFAIEEGTGGRAAVAFHHNNWNPSLVAILDDNGRRESVFWNSGWIEQVRWIGSGELLAAGFSNARDGGMVAILNPDLPSAAAPEPPGSLHHCDDCGRDQPLRMVVLPRSEVNLASHSRFNRASVEVLPSRIVAHTVEMPADGQGAIDAVYEFDLGLRLVSARYGERYWEAHRALEQEGRLNHSRGLCPTRDGPPSLIEWRPETGWRQSRIARERR